MTYFLHLFVTYCIDCSSLILFSFSVNFFFVTGYALSNAPFLLYCIF